MVKLTKKNDYYIITINSNVENSPIVVTIEDIKKLKKLKE